MGLESTGMKSIGSFYLRIFEPEGTTDNPKEERLRKMRLSGALLNDIDLAKSIDTTLTEGTSSFVLPVQLNQDGSFSKNSSVLSEEEHRVLLQTVLDHSESYAKNIVLGDISVAPLEIDRQRLPCSYCEFQAVCRFEKTSGKFRSRKVVLSSKEDVRELLQGGEK